MKFLKILSVYEQWQSLFLSFGVSICFAIEFQKTVSWPQAILPNSFLVACYEPRDGWEKCSIK